MQEINFNQVQVGMVLAKNIKIDNTVLFSEGTVIKPSTIHLMRQRKVRSIQILDRNEVSADLRKQIASSFRESIATSTGSILDRVKQGVAVSSDAIGKTVDQLVELIELDTRVLVNLYHVANDESYLYPHAINTSILSVILAQKLGLSEDAVVSAGMGALLHDVGMLNIPADILTKVDSLTESEWNLIKQHPELGMNEIARVPNVTPAVVEAVWQHHERMDGSGYPQGLKGSDISTITRIVTVCDVYDALISRRPYRTKNLELAALKVMVNHSRDKLDMEILQEFIKIIPFYPIGSILKLSNGQSGIVVAASSNPFRPILELICDNSKHQGQEIDLSNSSYFKIFIIEDEEEINQTEREGEGKSQSN